MNARETRVHQALLIYVLCLAAIWGVALIAVAIQSWVFHRPYPYNTILFIPQVRFTDFTIFYERFGVWANREAFFSATSPAFPFTYPAPLLLFFVAIWKAAPHPLRSYLFLVGAFAVVVAIASTRSLPSVRGIRRLAGFAVAWAAIASYPLFFLIDRANLEGFVWIAGSLGLYCFLRKHYSSAAILIGLAAAMKLFPGVLLLLFLAKRRYREFAIGLASIVTFTIGSLWLTGPSIERASKGIAMGMDFFRHTQILAFRRTEIGFDHSLFSWIKQILSRFIHEVPQVDAILPRIYLPYAAAAALGFTLLYLLRLRDLPVLNQVLALSALSVTLPFISYEYTLVNLIAPFIILVMFLASDVATGRVPLTRIQILALLLPFAVLFAPLTFLLLHGFGFGAQIKSLALLAVIGAASTIRLPSSLFSEVSDRFLMEFRLELIQREAEPSRRRA